jgi:hypothetical protein
VEEDGRVVALKGEGKERGREMRGGGGGGKGGGREGRERHILSRDEKIAGGIGRNKR